MNNGSLVFMTSFKAYQPDLTIGFKPPKGRVAAFVLVGDADKNDPNSFDAVQALNDLGWDDAVKITRLEQQRDELLAALKAARLKMISATMCHPNAVITLCEEAIDLAGDAIAKVEGKGDE